MESLKHFIKFHPFISVNILTLIFLFVYPPLAGITFVISIIAWFYRKERTRKERMQGFRDDAAKYIATVKLNKKLPTVKTTIFLDEGESSFLDEPAQLSETRAVRQSTGSGVGFRVMKGVYVGGYSGRSESHKEWRRLDRGRLILTNKKIIYNGSTENRILLLKDLISVNILSYGIELATQKRTKSSLFSVQNPYIWRAAINIIKNVKDPLNLGDINLEVKFE
jgi:hypothetical protein